VSHEPVPGAAPSWRRLPRARSVVAAAAGAAVLSGLPSTAWALVTGADPLAAARAAGTLLPCRRADGSLVGGALVHAVISLGWTVVLARVLPAGRRGRWGAVAGVAIAGFDLGLIGRRYPQIRALPPGPQVADHVAFGALAGAWLDVAARRRPTTRRPTTRRTGPVRRHGGSG
jgi:hypothetical protein